MPTVPTYDSEESKHSWRGLPIFVPLYFGLMYFLCSRWRIRTFTPHPNGLRSVFGGIPIREFDHGLLLDPKFRVLNSFNNLVDELCWTFIEILQVIVNFSKHQNMLNLNHWPYFQSTIISTLVNNKSSYPVGSFHPWPPHLPYRDSCIYLKGSSQVISNLLDANFRLAFLNLGWFIAPDKGIEPLHSIQRLTIRSNEESNSEVSLLRKCDNRIGGQTHIVSSASYTQDWFIHLRRNIII